MKLKFKHQKFQEEAVLSVCDCFEGQPFISSNFLIDQGNQENKQLFELTGFKNAEIKLRDHEIFENLKDIQIRNSLIPNRSLEKLNGRPAFTVEMETGTGKTYVYIKTMYELAKRYGWTKFIIVVPSIAIREGVLKTFQITADHFAEDYGKKARFFVYNSSRLNELDQFASDPGINVMIINTQAFNSTSTENKRIDMKLDSFRSRRPVDVVASVNPIIVIDEPQSVLGEGEGKKANKTRESIKKFKPLFYITYSATHRENFNMVYRLDAIDAYQKQLVKKINVKGISIKGSTATTGYLYLQKINVFPGKSPSATIVLEYNSKTATTIGKKIKTLSVRDNIYTYSGEIEAYKNGFTISEINAATGTVEFTGGLRLSVGDCVGEANEDDLRRIQIRETIASHLEKERSLFKQRIKVLSLFFIDEVAKYCTSNASNAEKGFYAETFESEYKMAVNHLFEEIPFNEDKDYRDFLSKHKDTPNRVHAGYFSGDPKTGKFKDSEFKGSMKESDDVSAYDLIMKNKERLLSFEEPVRFIFSHSALREGWDNPNVFQICTLRDTTSEISKRQSIGRGLRLSVDENGERQDAELLGQYAVQEVNELTVIANESYEEFARGLQLEYEDVLKNRPKEITQKLFENRTVIDEKGNTHEITNNEASRIFVRMEDNDLVSGGQLTEKYLTLSQEQKTEKVTEILPVELKPFAESIIKIAETVYNGKELLVSNARNKATLILNREKYASAEFKELWKQINSKSFYTVSFDEVKFIENAVHSLNKNLRVAQTVVHIEQGTMLVGEAGIQYGNHRRHSENLQTLANNGVKYDLIGEITGKTGLTRKCIGAILQKIEKAVFGQFKQNPELFITQAVKLIDEQKASIIIEHITYDKLTETWNEEAIFSDSQISGEYGKNVFDLTDANGKHWPLKKHLYDKLRYDSVVEKKMAENLDKQDEIELYIKLPGGFYINTPMGKYNPDWAISVKENGLKHIYFVAETKGDISDLSLREVEKAKIECAKKHFATISNGEVKYDAVDSFETLLRKIKT